MFATAVKFQMSVSTPGVAITFFLRFYARKSMKRNNTFVIASACLFLASKVNDEPRPLPNLTIDLFKNWFGRANPKLARQAGSDQLTPENDAFFAQLYKLVLAAEEAVLFTIGFDFNVDLVYIHMAALLRHDRFARLKDDVKFQQHLVNFCNDLMKKDNTMVLQYPARALAAAMYYVLLKTPGMLAKYGPMPLEGGTMPWYVAEGLDEGMVQTIAERYCSKLYVTGGGAKRGSVTGHKRPAPGTAGAAASAHGAASTSHAPGASTIVSAMPEASALCGGPADLAEGSALLRGGGGGAPSCAGGAPSATHTSSRWVGLDSTAETADVAGPSPGAWVPGGAGGQAGAVQSAAAAPVTSATRTPGGPSPGAGSSGTPAGQQHRSPPLQQQQQQHDQQQAPRSHAPAPSSAQLQQQPPRPSAPAAPPPQPPPPAAAEEDSDKEEDELEEGELPC